MDSPHGTLELEGQYIRKIGATAAEFNQRVTVTIKGEVLS